jgi:RND family efflux transporter MFP subunit
MNSDFGRPILATRNRNGRALGVSAAALLLLLTACGGKEEAKPGTAERVSGVRVAAVKLESVPNEIEAPGTVTSATTVQVAARVMGVVSAVAVREGDMVRAGQMLLTLDDREVGERTSAARAAVDEAAHAKEEAARGVAAAQAQADVTTKTYERYITLRDSRSVSPQEFDEVQARQRAAQETLAAAKARQQQVASLGERTQAELRSVETVAGYARITAPFSGVVVRRMVEPGTMATPGVPLLEVEDVSRYRLEVTLDSADATTIGRGAKARVEVDALPGKSFSGTVVEMEAGADPASHTVRARIELPKDAAIRSGLFGRARFARGEKKAITLPAAAVVRRGQLHGVYLVNAEGIARLRLVMLGKSIGDKKEILSGIGEGERVVMDAANRELDGKRVEK